MNEAFLQLPPEKQAAIHNAAMEVFGQFDYKHASTDLIAAKAGVSKGLLFYYFHNKKSLYLHTSNFVTNLITEAVTDDYLGKITDFFELITYATRKKVRLMAENPYIMQFSVRCFYSQREEISDAIQAEMVSNINEKYEVYFKHLDFSKFRDTADPAYIYKMLVWLTYGYLYDLQMAGKLIVLEEMHREFDRWTQMFRQLSYKEEYLCT